MASDAMITRFTKLLDPSGSKWPTSWDDWLTRLSRTPESTWHDGTGGWSAAEFDPPQRAKANVVRVHGLVLDYDKDAKWDVVRGLWSPTTGLLYTTKSHAEGADRLRVVLPLSRPVDSDEYERLWSWAAARSHKQGCPIDRQCRDASRFWYNPTMPPGGWRAERFTGRDVDPDAIFRKLDEETPNLSIVSQPVTYMPVSDEERYKRASAYLAKIPGAVQGESGSTTTFKACMAVLVGFDLTESDAEQLILSEYNPRCSPPWSEREIQHKVASCAKDCQQPRGYLLVERREMASRPAENRGTPVVPQADNWRLHMNRKADQTCRRGYKNVAVYVGMHPDYADKWSFNEMTNRPWFNGSQMPDSFVHEIRADFDTVIGWTPTREDTEAAIMAASLKKPFHPVRQYLRGIVWDGTPRLDSVAEQYLGTVGGNAASLVRKWMVGAVARAIKPGSKMDTALMLVGEQGYMKSTFFEVLGGEWHCGSPLDISNKDGMMNIHSSWIYELSELENVVGNKSNSATKAFLSSSVDVFRAPYERNVERRPRSMAICGTSNKDELLTDDTGSRRFWIVRVGHEIPSQRLREERDQLWAEAVAAFDAGESWWLTAEQEAVRHEANEAFHAEDSWTDTVRHYLRIVIEKTTVGEVLSEALKIEPGRQSRFDQQRVGAILRSLGLKRVRNCQNGARSWVYLLP